MTIVYEADFEGTSAGSLPTGWSAYTGNWAVTAVSPVSGIHALEAISNADGDVVSCQAFSALADMDLYYDISSHDYFVSPMLRFSSDWQNGYVWVPSSHTDLSSFNVYKRVAGSYTQIGNISTGYSVPLGAGTKLSARARIKGNVMSFKIWAHGVAEPSAWGGNFTDTGSAITGTGYFGFYNNSVSAGGTTVDNVRLGDTTIAAGISSVSNVNSNTVSVINAGSTGGTMPYSYQWYRSTTSGFTPDSGSLISGANGLAFVDTGLTALTTYFYILAVTDATSTTVYASPISVTTAGAGVLLNGTLHSASVGSTTATIIDSGASGGIAPYSYQWYRSITSGVSPNPSNLVSGATGTTLNDTSLTPSTTYYYKNVVTDNTGTKATSSEVSVTTAAGSTAIAVTDSSLFWSPGNWDHLAAGTFGVSTDTMQATAAGAYVKFSITGTVHLALSIDNTTNNGFGLASMPILCTSINNSVFSDAQIAPGASTLTLSSSLSPGATYAVEVYFKASSQTAGYADVWGANGVSPTNVLRINGILVDPGGTVSKTTLRPKRSIHFGDSMSAGEHANTDGSDDATQSFVPLVAHAFDSEYGQIAYGGQGWAVTGGSNVTTFVDGYNLYSSGRARSLSGYDYVFIYHGGNDARYGVSAAAIRTNCQSVLADLRASCGVATIIFVVTPPQGSYNSDLDTAVSTYRTTSGDTNVYHVDATPLFPSNPFTLTFGGSTEWTYDGVHPLIFGHSRLGAAYASIAKSVMNPPVTTTAAFSRARIVNGQ